MLNLRVGIFAGGAFAWFGGLCLLFAVATLPAHAGSPLLQGNQSDSGTSFVSPDLNADARVDVAAMDKYENAVLGLLNDGKFAQLDTIAASARTGKTRFAGGNWKLYIFYRALKQPLGGYSAIDPAWISHISRLESWAEANPQSVTARIALAGAYFEYSQKAHLDSARSAAPGELPDRKEQQEVQRRRHLAKLALSEAEELDTKCPHYYFMKQLLAGAPDMALLEKAIAFAPDYYYYYQLQALLLHIYPEDDNHNDDAERFADQMAARIGGDDGKIVYYEIAAAINGNPETLWPLGKFPWEKITAGYAALEKKYGPSMFKKNQIAYMAILQKDTLRAKPFFAEIGDQWDPQTWRSKANFDSNRNWSMSSPEFAAVLQIGIANYQTAAGEQYYKDSMTAYGQFGRSIWMSCLQQANGDPGGSFDLMLLVAADGTVQKTEVWPKTKFTGCLAPALVGQKLPTPPTSSYWLRFPTQPQATKTVANR